MNPAVILPIVAAIAAAVGSGASAFFVYLANSRVTRGTTNTSQADVLWAQMQNLLTITQARLDRVEDQRDKLLEAYGAIGPALSATNSALEEISVQCLAALRNQQEILRRLDRNGQQALTTGEKS